MFTSYTSSLQKAIEAAINIKSQVASLKGKFDGNGLSVAKFAAHKRREKFRIVKRLKQRLAAIGRNLVKVRNEKDSISKEISDVKAAIDDAQEVLRKLMDDEMALKVKFNKTSKDAAAMQADYDRMSSQVNVLEEFANGDGILYKYANMPHRSIRKELSLHSVADVDKIKAEDLFPTLSMLKTNGLELNPDHNIGPIGTLNKNFLSTPEARKLICDLLKIDEDAEEDDDDMVDDILSDGPAASKKRRLNDESCKEEFKNDECKESSSNDIADGGLENLVSVKKEGRAKSDWDNISTTQMKDAMFIVLAT